jgi:hypothetical protein
MTTIIINKRTRAGRTIFDLAQTLAVKNKSVIINDNGLEKPELTPKQIRWLNNLKKISVDVKSGNYKGQSLQSFLDEL